jgi:hypothetical protein
VSTGKISTGMPMVLQILLHGPSSNEKTCIDDLQSGLRAMNFHTCAFVTGLDTCALQFFEKKNIDANDDQGPSTNLRLGTCFS